jgi:hypothetical protein
MGGGTNGKGTRAAPSRKRRAPSRARKAPRADRGSHRREERAEAWARRPNRNRQLAALPSAGSQTPYYQTDFRGEAQAYSFSASWQPYNLDWRLGGNYFRFSRPFEFFYQVKLEADGLRVNNPGLTSLTADTDYLWIGGTATLRASLFNWDRLTWVTSYTYFDDTNSSRNSSKNSSQNIHLFTTNLAYNFTETGKTSISLEYQNGTNRDTLERLNQYLVTLNVKY